MVFRGRAAELVAAALSGNTASAEDKRTHAAYVAATGENIGYEEYLSLRAAWRRLGGSFYGPNVEHGSMPEAKLLQFVRQYLKMLVDKAEGSQSDAAGERDGS